FPGKNVWLQQDFMLIRDFVAVALIWLLCRWHQDKTVTRDLLLMAGEKEKAKDVRSSAFSFITTSGFKLSMI
ncbi:MAG: hypothetical protein ACE5G1_15360, partial [bacterium]